MTDYLSIMIKRIINSFITIVIVITEIGEKLMIHASSKFQLIYQLLCLQFLIGLFLLRCFFCLFCKGG